MRSTPPILPHREPAPMTDQTEGRLTVEQSVKFAFEAMQVGAQIANGQGRE